ncbi:unnamed protein product [Gordionus sp. m RMFG-2023]
MAEYILNPPPRWINCPRKGQIIADKFLPFKTPLDKSYNNVIPEINRFPPDMVFRPLKSLNRKIGLWVDLTNTNRFYNSTVIQNHDAEYVKIPCRGHGQAPSQEQTDQFVDKCTRFIDKNPNDLIAIHCTHGYNRTGFLICSYLIDHLAWR